MGTIPLQNPQPTLKAHLPLISSIKPYIDGLMTRLSDVRFLLINGFQPMIYSDYWYL
jgi:hypothetical protein